MFILGLVIIEIAEVNLCPKEKNCPVVIVFTFLLLGFLFIHSSSFKMDKTSITKSQNYSHMKIIMFNLGLAIIEIAQI